MRSNQGMDQAEIRRRRLRLWIDTDPCSMGNVEHWCSHYSQFSKKPLSPTYIRQLAPEKGKSARNIGERSARNFEAIGGKPRGWLDMDDLPPGAQSPGESLATLTAEAAEVAGMWLQLPEAIRKSIRAQIEAELRHKSGEKRDAAEKPLEAQNSVGQNFGSGRPLDPLAESGREKKSPAGKAGGGQ